MRFAIQCILANNNDDKRVALRGDHLRYIEANKERIFCGGPTIAEDGKPEMMLIILDAPDLPSAQAFMDSEPYNRAGIFARVTVRLWQQVLPESHPGELFQKIMHT
jgi:uncharacterized protein